MNKLSGVIKNIGIAIMSIVGIFLLVFKKDNVVKRDTEKENNLINKESALQSEIEVIDSNIDELKKNGVKEMTPEETVEYWKDEFQSFKNRSKQ